MKNFTTADKLQLTEQDVLKIVSRFKSDCLPIFEKRFNYYIGHQNILTKTASDVGKPCNKIVCNFVENIVNTYEGYAVGIPVTYNSDASDFETLKETLKYNDIVDEDAELFRNALIFGRAVEICYMDEDGKQRFKTLDPRECIPVYDNTLNQELLYVIRFWQDELAEDDTPTYTIQVYSSVEMTEYKSDAGFSSLSFVETNINPFQDVPFTIFSLNTEETAVSESIFSLQDAYNSLVSDSIDDWDSFCDAYLVLKGMTVDEDDLTSMKEKRALILDEGSDAEYLIKNTSTTEIEHLLSTVESKIRELSCCPNFNSETFGTSSGIAIRYRMMAMENNTASMLSNFKKALQRRIELLSTIEALKSGEALWRDIEITFTRNIPTDLSDTVSVINQLKGTVSNETLLGLLPFVDDVQEELERIQSEQQSNVSMYQFGNLTNE